MWYVLINMQFVYLCICNNNIIYAIIVNFFLNYFYYPFLDG